VIVFFQVPGQNPWTLESSPGPDLRRMPNCLSPEQRDKRKRDGDDDAMDVSSCHVFGSDASFNISVSSNQH
jgi:hypothetical protein